MRGKHRALCKHREIAYALKMGFSERSLTNDEELPSQMGKCVDRAL